MKAVDRVGALSGAVFVLLGLASNGLAQQPNSPDIPTGQQTLESLHWYASNPGAQVAASMEMFGSLAWMVFVAYLCMRVREAGWFAAAALVGGTLAIAVKLGSLAPTVGAYLLRDELSPENAQILGHLSGAAFMAHLLPAGIFVMFAGLAGMRAKELGRVIGWAGIVFGVINIAVVVAAGANMDRSFYAPSYLLILLWILVTSVVLAFARNGTRELSASQAGRRAKFSFRRSRA